MTVLPLLMVDEWGNVRVPKAVIDEINKRIEDDPNFKKMGWKTYSGFVNYIITRELDRYSKAVGK